MSVHAVPQISPAPHRRRGWRFVASWRLWSSWAGVPAPELSVAARTNGLSSANVSWLGANTPRPSRPLASFLSNTRRIDAVRRPCWLLADALYGDKRYEEAKFQYRRFLELFPTSPEAPKAQFNSAMCSFLRVKTIDRDQSTTQEAVQEFQRLIQSYPRSAYVDEATEKLAASRERLAAYELYVGRFYYGQEAYPAAIGRFEGLLKAYPEVSFADEVLFLLGNAYVRSDNPQGATSVFDELVQRYPQSRYANQAKARLASLR